MTNLKYSIEWSKEALMADTIETILEIVQYRIQIYLSKRYLLEVSSVYHVIFYCSKNISETNLQRENWIKRYVTCGDRNCREAEDVLSNMEERFQLLTYCRYKITAMSVYCCMYMCTFVRCMCTYYVLYILIRCYTCRANIFPRMTD